MHEDPQAKSDLPRLVGGTADNRVLAARIRTALRTTLATWLQLWADGSAAVTNTIMKIGDICERALNRTTDAAYWIDHAHMPLLPVLALLFTEAEQRQVGDLVDQLRALDPKRAAAWLQSADSRSPQVLLSPRHGPPTPEPHSW